MTSLQSFNLLAYGFLYLSVIALWFPMVRKHIVWPLPLFLTLTFALLAHRIMPIGVLPVALLAVAIYFSQQKYKVIQFVATMMVVILGVGLATHLFPGFHAWLVVDHVYISKDAIPFSLALNFDKVLVGLLILWIAEQRIANKKEWLSMLKQMVLPTVVVIVLVIVVALLLGFVHVDPKLPRCWLLWSVTNLLFVAMAEEAFFRGFLQNKLASVFKKRAYGNMLAIVMAGVLFGCAHYAGGVKYIALATVAGCGYGWIYARTRRIEASILMHFSVNLTHFLFFTYPMLA
jgi:membrane protease YdiL (CAAX protease family)